MILTLIYNPASPGKHHSTPSDPEKVSDGSFYENDLAFVSSTTLTPCPTQPATTHPHTALDPVRDFSPHRKEKHHRAWLDLPLSANSTESRPGRTAGKGGDDAAEWVVPA
jgi:hypothetical protein